MTKLIVFDDGGGDLAPLADLRASFDIRSGALTNRQRIERAVGADAEALFAPDDMAGLVEPGGAALNPDHLEGDVLLVNGRCALPAAWIDDLPVGRARTNAEGDIVAAHLGAEQALAVLEAGQLQPGVDIEEIEAPGMLQVPEDVIRCRDEAIALDLATLADGGGGANSASVIGDHPVSMASSAQILGSVTIDATNGPVVIDDEAVIRPGAILCGPVYVGSNSTVLDQALIKANTAIGPQCKVAGEVGGTIFQGCSNKAHDGHLGDAWIGAWANLGAGTTNSNLLNTYGEVPIRSRVDRPRRKSGLTFLGCIVGDHVKFAIGTRIMTGSVFGTGAMVACTAPPPSTVDAFGWVTDGEAQAFRLEKFTEVMQRVMLRRGIRPSDAYMSRIFALHLAALDRSAPGH